MFIGHFAVGVATKKLAPTIPIWVLLLAPQLMDLLFVPLVALGIEGYEPGPYGHDVLEAYYTHSLVGAAVIAVFAYWIGNRFWRDSNGGLILAALSFSHWIIDLFVHHQDLPILPGNLGGFPMLGFGLWNFEYSIFAIEVLAATIASILYFQWARTEKKGTRWFIGPVLVIAFFALLIAGDIPRLPPLA
jgi:hypothetical protein